MAKNSLHNDKEDARSFGVHLFCWRKVALWVVVAALWLLFDRFSKHIFNAYPAGTTVVPDLGNLGLVQFSVVHNFGVAWGTFAGQVPLIAILTSLMCAVIAVFAVYWSKTSSAIEMVALGLLFAGGIGNLYDRIVQGYVTDFITPLCIQFPTFNIADIGVTCGIVIFCLCCIVRIVRSDDAQQS